MGISSTQRVPRLTAVLYTSLVEGLLSAISAESSAARPRRRAAASLSVAPARACASAACISRTSGAAA